MIVSFLFVQSLNEINHFPKRLWQKNEVWCQRMQLNIVQKKKTQTKVDKNHFRRHAWNSQIWRKVI